MPQNTILELATLGGGCFWCLEAVFEQLNGVHKVESGYTGGTAVNPSYQQVCGGNTGHAEVVQITFDPAIISFRDLLEVFFTVHNPTTLNRQGHDIGTQYRSAIFAHSPEQKAEAAAFIAGQKLWPDPIVTEVVPLGTFYKAEDYHQRYFQNNPAQPYCQMVVNPKVAKAREVFAERMRP